MESLFERVSAPADGLAEATELVRDPPVEVLALYAAWQGRLSRRFLQRSRRLVDLLQPIASAFVTAEDVFPRPLAVPACFDA